MELSQVQTFWPIIWPIWPSVFQAGGLYPDVTRDGALRRNDGRGESGVMAVLERKSCVYTLSPGTLGGRARFLPMTLKI
jgi:hypothetical protein